MRDGRQHSMKSALTGQPRMLRAWPTRHRTIYVPRAKAISCPTGARVPGQSVGCRVERFARRKVSSRSTSPWKGEPSHELGRAFGTKSQGTREAFASKETDNFCALVAPDRHVGTGTSRPPKPSKKIK